MYLNLLFVVFDHYVIVCVIVSVIVFNSKVFHVMFSQTSDKVVLLTIVAGSIAERNRRFAFKLAL